MNRFEAYGSAALGIGRQRSDIGAVMVLEAPFMTDVVGVDDDEFVLSTARIRRLF